jgi:hypothetical protein
LAPNWLAGHHYVDRVIGRIVDFCVRHRWAVIVSAMILCGGAAEYARRHFAINTDIYKLISTDLPWRQRELAFQQAFPERSDSIIAVVHAPTAELASGARDALLDELSRIPGLFRSVHAPDGGAFSERNGLLYLSKDDLARTARQLASAGPIIGSLAADPSLRGMLQTLSMSLKGAQSGQYALDDLSRPLSMVADTLENVSSARPASFSWRVLLSG